MRENAVKMATFNAGAIVASDAAAESSEVNASAHFLSGIFF